ncbi:hypothetical protein F5X68DRAFT_257853 [Plectosphaerella plurivora]|uniref:Uncharacterized protein n=1 Tax=Plectosphaerella plurivora TaxID=936078 RepID=A0A9P8VL15_9PEZI|nr:hypothetical protein F5X68DRAFT_257853 [Plectosphaerella plurivora]
MRPMDHNAKLAMWSPYRTDRHPLAASDSPVKKVQLMRRNGKIGYAVTYQKPGGDTPLRLTEDARRADRRCCVDEARPLRTREWLNATEPYQTPVDESAQTGRVPRGDRCKSPRRKPAASEPAVSTCEGIVSAGQQDLWPGDAAAEAFDQSSAWPVLPIAPSPPATPWIPQLSTPDLSPLPEDRSFCPCEGDGDGGEAEEWKTKTQLAIDAQVSAAQAYIKRAQASAREGR